MAEEETQEGTTEVSEAPKPKKFAMVLADGHFDKAMMPFIMGNVGSAMGMEVYIFFTVFGLKVLKKGNRPKLPGFMAFFTGMIEKKMKGMGIESVQGQLEEAVALGVHLYACNTSMEVMGMKKEDLIDGVEIVGAAKFIDIAADCDIQLFIS